jgi:hypothetical protein
LKKSPTAHVRTHVNWHVHLYSNLQFYYHLSWIIVYRPCPHHGLSSLTTLFMGYGLGRFLNLPVYLFTCFFRKKQRVDPGNTSLKFYFHLFSSTRCLKTEHRSFWVRSVGLGRQQVGNVTRCFLDFLFCVEVASMRSDVDFYFLIFIISSVFVFFKFCQVKESFCC